VERRAPPARDCFRDKKHSYQLAYLFLSEITATCFFCIDKRDK
jgi:hypothetical protein